MLFSKRCQKALKEKKVIVSIPLPTRRRILKLVQNFNEYRYRTTETGFNYNTSILEELPGIIESKLGIELICYHETESGKTVKCSMEDFILRGVYPPNLFDTIELFYNELDNENKFSFQSNINQIFEESDTFFRIAEGQIFPVDSIYINEFVINKTYELLNNVKFLGALKEFNKARSFLVNGDYEEAINNANLAIESVIKQIINVEKAKPGELYNKLIKSGLVPEYYDGFLKAFEKNILRCVAIIRNEELGVGHGRGSSNKEIPSDLAELAINLSGVIINYLIKKFIKIETITEKDENIEGIEFTEDDIPF